MNDNKLLNKKEEKKKNQLNPKKTPNYMENIPNKCKQDKNILKVL